MNPRQRGLLLVLGVLVAATGAVALLVGRDDGRSDVSADAATTSTEASAERSSTTSAPSSTSSDTTEAPASSSTTSPDAPTTSTTRASTAAAPSTTAPAPPFEASVSAVTAADLGSSWRAGCPVGPEALAAIDASHWGYDGAVHQGRLIVAADQADRIVAVLRDVYEARFPIERMVPVQHYGSDDQASMRANNTSGFNCRYVAGTERWSEHSHGRAVDVNPLVNPYVRGSSVDPPEGARYADRSLDEPGMIKAGDAVVRAFERQGWHWGGYWTSGQDYQHFSQSGR